MPAPLEGAPEGAFGGETSAAELLQELEQGRRLELRFLLASGAEAAPLRHEGRAAVGAVATGFGISVLVRDAGAKEALHAAGPWRRELFSVAWRSLRGAPQCLP